MTTRVMPAGDDAPVHQAAAVLQTHVLHVAGVNCPANARNHKDSVTSLNWSALQSGSVFCACWAASAVQAAHLVVSVLASSKQL